MGPTCPIALGSVGVEPYIECVFENELVELDAAGTLAAAEANEHTLITAETRRLHIAAHWADLHPGDAVVQSRLPGTERAVLLGGDGTPTVGDFAPAELGCVLRISDGSACRLIGDALDLRHRLPKVWAAAQAGQVPAYQARRIASATRHLTAEQCRPRKVLYEDPELGFCVCGHVYQGGANGSPHDHGSSWAIYGVAEGDTEMTDWRIVKQGSGDMPSLVEPVKTYVMKPGDAHLYDVGVVHSPRRDGLTRLVRIEGANLDRIKRSNIKAA